MIKQVIELPLEVWEEIKNDRASLKRIEEKIDKLTTEEKYYTVDELAKKMGVSYQTIQNWKNNGKVRFTKINGKLFCKDSDLQEAINDNSLRTKKYATITIKHN